MLRCMHVRVGDVLLFFDVEGAKLRPEGATMHEVPTLVLLHGWPWVRSYGEMVTPPITGSLHSVGHHPDAALSLNSHSVRTNTFAPCDSTVP
jgi:hypothetical protein